MSIYLIISGLLSVMDSSPDLKMRSCIMIIGLASMVCGIALFRFNPWARKATMILLGLIVGFNILTNTITLNKQEIRTNEENIDFVVGYVVPHILFYGLLIFFLSRPKVKNQFNPKL